MINRVIGSYTGRKKGPLLICFAAMHGNEPAGVQALELMFKMLEVEPITNPSFCFNGRLVGLIGNRRAYRQNQRFINKDLNRFWKEEHISWINQQMEENLDAEDLEIKELLELVQGEIEAYKAAEVVILDLHTTTAEGGIFSIPSKTEKSVEIGMGMHAPVIKGLLEGLQGTSLHYFTEANLNVPTTAIVFESGQHNDPMSVNRAIAAITNCMRAVGCVEAKDVEHHHDDILQNFSEDLPKLAELIMRHPIVEGDGFKMNPGYKNFQRVQKGEILAYDNNGPIKAITRGRILMPLYQKQGNDGFFLITDEEHVAF